MGTRKVKRSCLDCEHEMLGLYEGPCGDCWTSNGWKNFSPKVKRDPVIKMCEDCVNKPYCEKYPHTANGCKLRGGDGWSPVNVTKKEVPPVQEEDVSKQSHYTRFKIQPLEFCKANDLGYLEGNVIKYVCRYPYKGQAMKDLLKARDYINHLIEKQKEKENA